VKAGPFSHRSALICGAGSPIVRVGSPAYADVDNSGETHAADLEAFMKDLHELYTKYGNATDSSLHSMTLVRNARAYGLTSLQVQRFLTPMLRYENASVRQWAEGTLRVLQMVQRQGKVELEAPTLQGEPFNLESLHGRIVLLDYWNTLCSSCIAAMPRIHGIYQRYREHGFEVVSVCFDGKSRTKQVERVEKELGLTWTTLLADDISQEFYDRYGFSGVPQYMLLDREGRLVATTSEVDMGRNLEAILDRILTEERNGRR
jgi:thiol-disulfide isomerase/thioredoxin